ncbi:hypothetical protein MN0502_29620 [Arthrobacter sp. MN05-02]|nr:hypothetical protein MN0502_29620 [Arthrobacter sp. MN05-02]
MTAEALASVTDADDVGAREGIPEHGLEHGSGEPEAHPHQDPDHRAGKLVLHHDETGARDVGTPEDPEEIGDGHRVGTEQDVHGEQHDDDRRGRGQPQPAAAPATSTDEGQPCGGGRRGRRRGNR